MTNLIQAKQSTRYPSLTVLKYKNKVFYDNLWHTSPDLLESRGHVVDSDGNIVIRPFTKVFNRFENGVDINRDSECLYIRKINGFMAAMTYVPSVGEVIVSTTGSLDSPFVTLAEKYLDSYKWYLNKMYARETICPTLIFEICDESDPHIINEETGAYLLGIRFDTDKKYHTTPDDETMLDDIAHTIECMRPEWGVARFSDIVNMSKSCQHEGYMVYEQTGDKTCLKLKSPYYLVMKAFARRKNIMTLDIKKVDEEFYPLIQYIKDNIGVFDGLDEQSRLQFMKDYIMMNKE